MHSRLYIQHTFQQSSKLYTTPAIDINIHPPFPFLKAAASVGQ